MKLTWLIIKFKLNCLIAYIFFNDRAIDVPLGTKQSTFKVISTGYVYVVMNKDKSNTMFVAVFDIYSEVDALNVKVREAAWVAGEIP